MIDVAARQKLQQRQQNNQMVNAISTTVGNAVRQAMPQPTEPKSPQDLTQKIDKLANAIQEKQAMQPVPAKPASPAELLATELQSLQRVIGKGSLIDSLEAVSKNMGSMSFNGESLNELRTLVTDLSQKIKILAELEAKIPTEIRVQLKEELTGMKISGDVAVQSMPPVKISNLSELAGYIQKITGEITSLTNATVAAIRATKTEMPKSFTVANEVKISDWTDLIDGIEELKKGFNLLINKEVGTLGFPTGLTLPVEIQNWKVAQPVTNVSINPNRGTVQSTAVTVTAALTPLPGTALADRRSMTIFNNSSAVIIYVGGSNVTSANGIPVFPGSYGPSLDAGPRNIVYAVTASGSADVRVLELNDLVAGGDS